MRRTTRRLLAGSALVVGIAAGAGALPGAAGAAVLRHRVSVAAYPAALGYQGGALAVVVHPRGATRCGVSFYGPGLYQSSRVACASRPIRLASAVAPNISTSPVVIRVLVRVWEGRAVLARRLTVTEGGAPPPPPPPPPPPSVDYYSAVAQFGVYGNIGTEGDCTVAAAADLEQVWAAQAGQPDGRPTTASILAAYQAIIGPSANPADGAYTSEVLYYWESQGIGGQRIAGASEIALDPTSLENALAQDGALYGVIDIPAPDYSWAMESPAVTWSTNEAPPGSPVVNDHAVAIVGYNGIGPLFATWGYVQQVTWAWWSTWGLDAYAIQQAA